MYSYPTLTEEEQEEVIELQKDLLPDDAELVLLSFTGGRAFGWGHDKHDIDVHGFFAKPDWYYKCHSQLQGIDMTVTNIQSIEDPNIRWRRWKQFYDKSNPIYVHDDFDFEEDFISECTPEHVKNIFPFDLDLQFARMENQFIARSALHTYKEMMIPHYFLEEGIIETNIVDEINENEQYDYPGLRQCVRKYKDREDIDLDEELIKSELREMRERLKNSLIEHTDWKPKE